MDVVQELLDSLREHQSAPHQCGFFVVDEHAGRDHLEGARSDLALIRNDLGFIGVADSLCFQSVGHVQHAGNGKAPDVCVQHANHVTTRSKCTGEIDGHRALADAALAARDCEHSRVHRNLCISGLLASVPAGTCHHGAALLARHLTPVDGDLGDSWVGEEAGLDVVADLHPERAATNRELHGDRDDTVCADADVSSHPKVDDVVAEFGVHHGPQKCAHFVCGGGRHDSAGHVPKPTVEISLSPCSAWQIAMSSL